MFKVVSSNFTQELNDKENIKIFIHHFFLAILTVFSDGAFIFQPLLQVERGLLRGGGGFREDLVLEKIQ